MPSSKLLIVGATRGVGLQLVSQALDAGHDVTAFSRSASSIDIRHARLRKIDGTLPQDAATLANAMAGRSAVICALGRGQSLASHHLMEQSLPVILAAMRSHGVRRLLYTSAIGVGDAIAYAPLFSRVMAKVLLRGLYADKVIAERLIRESGLDWTIAQPAALTNGPMTGRYQAAERLSLRGMPKISRADVAHFLLAQVHDTRFIGKTVVLAS
jgi:putative NADH-flavin reductase